MTILDRIAEASAERAAKEKQIISAGEMKERAAALGPGNGMAFRV